MRTQRCCPPPEVRCENIRGDTRFLTREIYTGDVKMHDGFAETQWRTADLVLSTVQSALNSTGAKSVLVTGHSLGAAVASIDAIMLKSKLDPSIELTSVVYGLPRVGNQAWADLVDSMVSVRPFQTRPS